MSFIIAADTGGTFTDVAVYDTENCIVRYGKTLTTYGKLVDGVINALKQTDISLKDAVLFKHGTTHVINTFLQRKGAKTALITTKGFADLIEIARGNRPVPFQFTYRRDPPLVPRTLRFEVDERMDSEGLVQTPLSEEMLAAISNRLIAEEVEAVAVSFLNSYSNPIHEERAVALLTKFLPNVYVTSGTSITRDWFEYERTSTAIANAYVGPQMNRYMRDFDERLKVIGFSGRLYMMGSNGGVMSVERSLRQPAALVESGPVGGCIATAAYARAQCRERVIAFDMGGTTAKCALVEDGHFDVQPIYYVGGYNCGFPIKVGVLDIVEIGTGGGSIAEVDSYGSLTVGPRSAGSEPGPAGFGQGGKEPTVTDACIVLGYISTGPFLDGSLRIDPKAAYDAILKGVAIPLGFRDSVDKACEGILDMATVQMAGAIREITIERGLDTRDFALCVFGGNGPLFGSKLARILHISTIIVPPNPGNFATLGMLIAGARVDLSRTMVCGSDTDGLFAINKAFLEMEETARSTIQMELGDVSISFDHWLEVRYSGQTHTVRLSFKKGCTVKHFIESFEALYTRRYGHIKQGNDIEVLGMRIGAEAGVPSPKLTDLSGKFDVNSLARPETYRSLYCGSEHGRLEAQVWRRDLLLPDFEISGPAIIEEYTATTILFPGDKARANDLGELIITCAID